MIVGRYYPEISGGNLQCKKIIDNLNKEFLFEILTFTKNKKLNYFEPKKNLKYQEYTAVRGCLAKLLNC